jgi:hypothetical protein
MAERARPQVRLFDSEFLESFSRISPRSVALFWGPLSVIMLALGLVAVRRSPAGIVETVLGFLLLWTLFDISSIACCFTCWPRSPAARVSRSSCMAAITPTRWTRRATSCRWS